MSKMNFLPTLEPESFLTIAQAAQILKVSTKTLRRWEKQGFLIPNRTPGNQRRYTSSQISNFTLPKPQPIPTLVPTALEQLAAISPASTKPNLSSHLIPAFAFLIAAIIPAITLITYQDRVIPLVNKLPQTLNTLATGLAVNFSSPDYQLVSPESISDTLTTNGVVLASESSATSPTFRVNVPAFFASTATVSGELTAPNIIYSLTAGPGISVSPGQTPTITNTGVLSLQGQTGPISLTSGTGISISGTTISSTVTTSDSFKTIKVSGQNDIVAGSATDSLTFTAGSNISLSTNTLSKLAIGSAGQVLSVSSGLPSWAAAATNTWTSASGNLYPTTTSDRVVIGGNTSTVHQLEVNGAEAGKALVSFNETGDQDIFTASASGTRVLSLNRSGVLTMFSNAAATADLLTFTPPTASGTQFTGNLTSADLSADRTWTLPNNGGTIALTSDITAGSSKWQLNSGVLSPFSLTTDVNLGSTATSSAKISLAGSLTRGLAAAIINQTEDTDVFTASASGIPIFAISQAAGATDANGIKITAAATGAAPTLASFGTDTNIGLIFNSKGTGTLAFTSANATGTTSTSAFTFTDNSLTSGTAGYISSSSITTGKLWDVNTGSANTFSSGTLINTVSTSTALTSGNLALFDWAPSAVATSSGDLFRINIGNAGDTTGNLFNITSSLPTSFTAAGDVSIAYDIQFTNQTASYIKSKAPFYLQVGESFESNNLTAQLYNSGRFIVDTTTTGGVTVSSNISAAQP